MDRQAQRRYGVPAGYGPPPASAQPPGYAADNERTQQLPASPHPGYGPQPGYPPPGGYRPMPGYGGPAGHPNGQQASGFPPSAQQRIPPGAPGPVPQWWERFLGRFLDNLIFVVVSSILSSIIGSAFLPSAAEILTAGFRLGYGYYLAMAVGYLITGALFAGYDVLMHSRNGQTLGKLALKTRVGTPSGGVPDQASLLRRAAFYPASGFALGGLFMLIPGFALTGLSLLIGIGYAVAMSVPILTDPLGRGLHDKWANTIVVKA